jgi:pheromone a factor receptor
MDHLEMLVIALLCAVLLFVPAPAVMRSSNVAMIFALGWLLGLNLISAVSAIVSGDVAYAVATWWCDLGTCSDHPSKHLRI